MPLLKVQVSSAGQSTFPRDRIVNTFHLNKEAGALGDGEYDGLASDVVDAWQLLYGATGETECRIYNARGDGPQFPVGQNIQNVGTARNLGGPMEVALCLSYYGNRNLPRTRGRMFFCVAAMGLTATTARPSTATMNAVLAHADRIAALGGLDVDWQVYSPTGDTAENVKLAYCDDEWDTMRSRGLKPTTRVTKVITE